MSEPPVPYTPEHKQKTREKILACARKLWKSKGFGAVSIDDIMGDAGLTRGGFYAHFKSKDDLFAHAALDTGMLNTFREIAASGDIPDDVFIAHMLDFYLSPDHRDNPAEGCPLVALSDDIYRHGDAAKDAFTHLTKLSLKLTEGVTGGDKAKAALVLSAMTGAVHLARATNDTALSDRILADCKAGLIALLKSD